MEGFGRSLEFGLEGWKRSGLEGVGSEERHLD